MSTSKYLKTSYRPTSSNQTFQTDSATNFQSEMAFNKSINFQEGRNLCSCFNSSHFSQSPYRNHFFNEIKPFFCPKVTTGSEQIFLIVVFFLTKKRKEAKLKDFFDKISELSVQKPRQQKFYWKLRAFCTKESQGPETFSVARAHALEGVRVCPIRSAAQPWGFPTCHSDHSGVLRTFVMFGAPCGTAWRSSSIHLDTGYVTAPPSHEWDSPSTRTLWCLLTKAHWPSLVGPRNPRGSLVKHATPMCAKGTNIVLDATGRLFKTAHLKEYHGLLCRGLTQMYSDWLGEAGFLPQHQQQLGCSHVMLAALAASEWN